MFDIGFLELIVVAIVALLVLGPERLPKAARTAGRWIGRVRRMAHQFSSELDRQIELEELREKLRQAGQSLDIESDVQQIHTTVRSALDQVDGYEPPLRRESAPSPHPHPHNDTGTEPGADPLNPQSDTARDASR
jgi:sec-independent protein translocase protein TatB